MSNTPYFFIDKKSWTTQIQSGQKAFGRINNEKYRLQSTHQFPGGSGGSGAPHYAYAVTKSLLLIQPDNTYPDDLVNIILKPLNDLQWEYDDIAYFVYRGISKASLITTLDINDVPTEVVLEPFNQLNENEHLLNRIEENKQLIATAQSGSVQDNYVLPRYLGYNYSAILDTENPDLHVPDNVAISKVIEADDDYSEIQLPIVEAGMIIGEFMSKDGIPPENGGTAPEISIGFEIVGERIGYEYTMGHLRGEVGTLEHILEIEIGIEKFKEWHKKQETLNYFDPAAFYFNFFRDSKKIKIPDYNGGEQIIRSEMGISELNYFDNKNIVYLDIRHQTGFSYNYFGEYGGRFEEQNKLGFVGDTDTQLSLNRSWPVYAIDKDDLTVLEDIEIDDEDDQAYLNIGLNLSIIRASLKEKYRLTRQVATKNIKQPSIYVYGKQIIDYIKIIPLLDIEGEDEEKASQVFFRLPLLNSEPFTNQQASNDLIGGYFKFTVQIVIKANDKVNGLIINNNYTAAHNVFEEDEGLRRDNHYFDLMFPIFDMVKGLQFKEQTDRVSIRMYSSANSCLIPDDFYHQLYIPKIGVAVDNENYTFFAYAEDKSLFQTAIGQSDVDAGLISSFTIQGADFLSSLTRKDLNVTLIKRGETRYRKDILDNREYENPDPTMLSYVTNNAVEFRFNELATEFFDSITITKAEYETLELLKSTHFSSQYPILLGVVTAGSRSKENVGEMERLKFLLKGFKEIYINGTLTAKPLFVWTDINVFGEKN